MNSINSEAMLRSGNVKRSTTSNFLTYFSFSVVCGHVLNQASLCWPSLFIDSERLNSEGHSVVCRIVCRNPKSNILK